MKVITRLSDVCNVDGSNLYLKPAVSTWLSENNFYKGPDRYFAQLHMPEDLRPLETWDSCGNDMAVFYFNNHEAADLFKAKWTAWKPCYKHTVLIDLEGSGHWSHLKAMAGTSRLRMWCNDQNILIDQDVVFTVESETQYDVDNNRSSIGIGVHFRDLSPALICKLTWGGR